MHIENYREKKKNSTKDNPLVSFEFAESGRIAVLERRFDEVTGVPTLKPTQETDSRDMADSIAHYQQQADSLNAIVEDLQALAKDIAAKEAEGEKLRKENGKTK